MSSEAAPGGRTRARRQRGQDEFVEQLRIQQRFLANSARLYDDGAIEEAVRLAVVVRTLVHETSRSHALLAQLGIQRSLDYVNTYRFTPDYFARMLPGTTFFEDQLVGLASLTLTTEGMAWQPIFGSRGARLSEFDQWWAGEHVEHIGDRRFTRKDLILIMANEDGGAHFDPSIDIGYDALTKDARGNYFTGPVALHGDQSVTIDGDMWAAPKGDIASASVRQIAWELERSLETI